MFKEIIYFFIHFNDIMRLGDEYLGTTIYEATNEKFEKLIKYVVIILFKAFPPNYVLLCMILSFYNYFASNLSEESFILLFPIS